MPTTTTALDLTTDVTSLTAAVCDIESVSLDEEPLADAVEAALRDLSHLSVTRVGNTVVARTVRFPETTVVGEPITSYASTSTGARAYRSLAKEVLAR